MEGQAGRTEYAVTDAACFPVRFTQFTATVRALRAGRSRTGIADRIYWIVYFYDFAVNC